MGNLYVLHLRRARRRPRMPAAAAVGVQLRTSPADEAAVVAVNEDDPGPPEPQEPAVGCHRVEQAARSVEVVVGET